jgi:hypothetical protein
MPGIKNRGSIAHKDKTKYHRPSENEKERMEEETIKLTVNEKAQMVLDEMGILLNKKPIQANTKRATLLKHRLKEFDENQMVDYIKHFWKKWADWELRNEYFRPETLFQKARVWDSIDEVELQEADLDPAPASDSFKKDPVNKSEISFEIYRREILKPSRFFGYHFKRMNEYQKNIIESRIQNDYEEGKPVYKALGITFFEQVRKGTQ